MESHFGQKGIEFQKGYRVAKILPRTTGKLVQFRTFENRVPRYLKITYREYAAKITYRENETKITYREYAANKFTIYHVVRWEEGGGGGELCLY